MVVRHTLQLGDPRLREPCSAVVDPTTDDVAHLAEDLTDTLDEWVSRTGYGRGIAAPQIGVAQRVVHLGVHRRWLLVNPRITERSNELWYPWDACLSFSVEFFCVVERSVRIGVEYEDREGRSHRIEADGELAELLQHEIDHLDGILAVDRMTSPSTLCMRSEFEARFRHKSPYR